MKKNNLIASSVFDKISKVYDFFLTLFTAGFINKWQKELVKQTKDLSIILDVGTGTGEVIKKIKQENKSSLCIGIDLSMGMLKKAQKKVKDENTFFIRADIYRSPFKNNSFSAIFLSLTYRHLEHNLFIKETNRILKRTGFISIFDTGKLENRALWNLFLFFVDKVIRYPSYLIFSKDQYDYFVESIKNSVSIKQIIRRFEKDGYNCVYKKSVLFGLAFIVIFQKEK